jgi:N-carbamoylputrescine amidase
VKTLRVAVAQMEVALGDVPSNTKEALRLIAEARALGAGLVVLPELSLSGYSLGKTDRDTALAADGAVMNRLAAAAGACVVAVGFAERDGPRTYNSVALLQRNAVQHLQRKLTLPTYDRFEEHKHFWPGQRLRACDLLGARAAVLICNDAWHPVLPFLAVQDGAEILIVPANSSTAPGATDREAEWEGHWEDILRFHARVLQCYVVYANRVGTEAGAAFYGGSLVMDPEGRRLAAGKRFDPDLLIADLDLSYLRALRRRFPLQKDARLELVHRETARLLETATDQRL